MYERELIGDCLLLLSLWAGGLGLVVARLFDWRRFGLLIGTALGSAPLAADLAGWPSWPLVPAALLGGAVVAAAIRRRFGEALSRLASRRALQVLVLVAAPLIACGWVLGRGDEAEEAESLPVIAPTPTSSAERLQPLNHWFYTDRGQAVRWFAPRIDDASDEIRTLERRYGSDYTLNLIRTSPPDSRYNCHGWVFAGGACWVRNEDVDLILLDNEYTRINQPEPGDLVIYRDADQKPKHTGVVRIVQGDSVLVESKWGHVGRYVHPVACQPYSEDWSYYRSVRTGHVLSPSNPDSAATPP